MTAIMTANLVVKNASVYACVPKQIVACARSRVQKTADSPSPSPTPEDAEPAELERGGVRVVHEELIVACVDDRRAQLFAMLEKRFDSIEHGTVRPHG